MDNKKPTDDDVFRQMMSDVKPLSAKKVAQSRSIPPIKAHTPPKRQPTATLPNTPGFIPSEYVADIGAEEVLFFAHPGLQHRLLRQFRRGDLRPEIQLDLHGCTIAEAASLLANFLAKAQNAHQRCVSVIHGKGYRSAKGRPALKAQVDQWLRNAPAVLAFSSALAKDGGAGALYVLLRRH